MKRLEVSGAVRPLLVSLGFKGLTGTLHGDLCTFIATSRSLTLRIKHILDESCKENQNTCFTFNNVFPKIVPFVK